jgi:NADH-quinone oxidoreductase subunit J
LALGIAGLMGFTALRGVIGGAAGFGAINRLAGGSAQAVALVIFGRYAVAFEAASALVITAALAAMVLAHADRHTPKERQRERVEKKLRQFAANGATLAPEPAPGVYARHNAATYPALLPNGRTAPGSVAAALEERGQAVVGDPSLKRPAQSLHNRLAADGSALDGRPALLADIPDADATIELEAAPPPGTAAPGGHRPRRGEAS